MKRFLVAGSAAAATVYASLALSSALYALAIRRRYATPHPSTQQHPVGEPSAQRRIPAPNQSRLTRNGERRLAGSERMPGSSRCSAKKSTSLSSVSRSAFRGGSGALPSCFLLAHIVVPSRVAQSCRAGIKAP
jgi:hypothetical protein